MCEKYEKNVLLRNKTAQCLCTKNVESHIVTLKSFKRYRGPAVACFGEKLECIFCT